MEPVVIYGVIVVPIEATLDYNDGKPPLMWQWTQVRDSLKVVGANIQSLLFKRNVNEAHICYYIFSEEDYKEVEVWLAVWIDAFNSHNIWEDSHACTTV